DGLEGQLAAAEQAVEDERAARESLADRLVELESETERLRHELELRDAELAALGATPRVDDTTTTTVPAEEPAAQQEQATEPPAEQARRQVRTPPPEPTLVDRLTSPLVLGGLLGLLVLIAIGVFAWRRSRTTSEANRVLASEPEDDATQF